MNDPRSDAGMEPQETSFEIALDDEPEPTRGPVYVDAVVHEHEKRPVIPASLRGASNIRATVRRTTDRTRHVAAYHAVRSPWYLAATLWYAAKGLGRIARRQVAWWWVHEQFPMRMDAILGRDIDRWLKLHHETRATRYHRGLWLLAELVALAVVGLVVAFTGPWWVPVAIAVAAVPALARYGRPIGKAIITPAIVEPRFRKLTADVVLRAYYAAKLGHPDKPDQRITFGSTMARDPRQQGSQVVIDLPYGQTFERAMDARAAIASGLDVAVQQVFLTADRSSERRHLLWVADRDLLAVGAGPSPLITCKPTDIWAPARFGLDQRGDRVDLEMMWSSILVGAQPRKGKTFAARLLALHAALDPYVRLIVIDGKAAPDWRGFSKVAERTIFGFNATPEGDPVEILIATLQQLQREIRETYDQLSALPVEICPEGKLTRELARDPRDGRFRVRFVVLEEIQEYLETPDQTANKEIARLLVSLVKIGPAAGTIILTSTQKPAGVGAGDVSRMFNSYRDNHQVRFALRCANRHVSDAVLGGDAYSEGHDGSAIPIGMEYRGVGILYGATDDTPMVRTYLANGADADRILTAARAHRERAGTLIGAAAGAQADIRPPRDVLDDVLKVWSYVGRAGGLQWPRLAELLADEFPAAYAGTTAESVSALLRAEGVPSVDVKAGGTNLKGCKREAVDAAIRRRQLTST
jgi:S-DNA-T family DNA segregation ATPase FtsK/SpoIIIE